MTQQMVDIAKVPAIEPALQSLEQLYTFRRPEEVSWFLQAHPFLIPLLLEAYAQIAKHFGQYPLVFLEVVTDPEAIDDRQLVAFIRTDLDPMGALASLDQFDRSWWLEASHRSRGKMCIHLEFGSIFEPIPVKKGSKMWSSKEVRQ